ncbi:hypothetical protein Sjap_004418 [Stephania japonica]|uniref:Uncharacterized protein n=1 Tax=Stephania japonica TaxID=461633 RepID=A0AAP0K378_9MAGN
MALLRCSLMALLLLFVVVMAGAEKAKNNCSNSSDVGAEKAPKNNSSLLAIAPVLFVSGYGFGVLPVDESALAPVDPDWGVGVQPADTDNNKQCFNAYSGGLVVTSQTRALGGVFDHVLVYDGDQYVVDI